MRGEPLANGQREVYTLDVKQADAHAIITKDGSLNLIDADKTKVGDELDTILDGRTAPETDTGCVPIETFVLTHIHDDHSDGVEILHDHGYEIQHVVEPARNRYEVADPETGKPRKGVKYPVMKTYVDALEKHGVESIRQVSEGESLSTDWAGQVVAPPSESGKLEFPSPETGRKNTLKPTGANANSLAFKTEGSQSALFMGDMEDTGGLNGETWLMHQHDSDENDVDLDADFLVLAHHGSNNATSGEFLERVDPEMAVISSGLDNDHTSENEHDAHPHDATLKCLHDREIDVHWTAGHGTTRIDLDSDTAHPEPTTDLETTDAADLAALKHYCRDHEIDPETVGVLPPDLPEETPEWARDAAPMIADTQAQFVDGAIANAESVEELRETLDPAPDAHDQLRETVQADREEHVTTRNDVKRNREAYFNAKEKERDYKHLPLHTRLRANLPARYGGIEHPLKDVPSSDDINGPRKVEAVPKAVKNLPAAEHRANDEHVKAAARYTREAEEAADEAVDTAPTRETLCRSLRDTPGAHQDFLYAIETPDAHEKNKPEKGLDDLLEQTNQRERTSEQTQSHDRDMSLGL